MSCFICQRANKQIRGIPCQLLIRRWFFMCLDLQNWRSALFPEWIFAVRLESTTRSCHHHFHHKSLRGFLFKVSFGGALWMRWEKIEKLIIFELGHVLCWTSELFTRGNYNPIRIRKYYESISLSRLKDSHRKCGINRRNACFQSLRSSSVRFVSICWWDGEETRRKTNKQKYLFWRKKHLTGQRTRET